MTEPYTEGKIGADEHSHRSHSHSYSHSHSHSHSNRSRSKTATTAIAIQRTSARRGITRCAILHARPLVDESDDALAVELAAGSVDGQRDERDDGGRDGVVRQQRPQELVQFVRCGGGAGFRACCGPRLRHNAGDEALVFALGAHGDDGGGGDGGVLVDGSFHGTQDDGVAVDANGR